MNPTCIVAAWFVIFTLPFDLGRWRSRSSHSFSGEEMIWNLGTNTPCMQSVYPRIEDVVVIAAFLSHTLTAAELELCVFWLLVQISGKGETIRLIRIYPIIPKEYK